MRKRTSFVWKFFDDPGNPNESHINCNICKKPCSYSNSTSAMKKHIISQHASELERNKAMNIDVSECMDTDFSTNSQEVSASLLVKAFCCGGVSFRFSECPEFVEFVKSLNPEFNVPSPRALKGKMVQSVENYLDSISRKVKNIESFTLITDGYSDFTGIHKFYSLHVLFVDRMFKRHVIFCGIQPVGDTSIVSTALIRILDRIRLKISKCSMTVTDGGSNLVSLAEMHTIPYAHCACHLLNLCFQDFGKLKKIEVLKRKCTAMAAFLSRNESARKKIDKENNEIPIPLPIPQTRWSYLFLLFQSVSVHNDSLKCIDEIQDFLPRGPEHKLLNELLPLLEPIHEAIKKFEKDDSYFSEVLPTMVSFIQDTESVGSQLSRRLSRVLKNRVSDYISNADVLFTTLLDPRFAFLPNLLEDEKWDEVAKHFKTKYFPNEISQTNQTGGTSPSPAKRVCGLQGLVQRQAKKNSDGVEDEIMKCKILLSSNRPNWQSDPLFFWFSQEENLPNLAKMSRRLLSSPASAAVSERLFSQCSDVFRQKKRNRIRVDTLNNILLTTAIARKDRVVPLKENADSDDESDQNENGEEKEREILDLEKEDIMRLEKDVSWDICNANGLEEEDEEDYFSQ